MTTSDGPLVPANVDLRDFPFYPLDIIRFFGSDFDAITGDAPWRAGMTLYIKSFHQVPAASIPDDEVVQARLAELGRNLKDWRKIKDAALRGWVKCSDGRLYHPVVAEKALEAWIEKVGQRKSSAAGNAKRHNHDFDPTPFDAQIETASRMLAALNPNSRLLTRRSARLSQPPPDGNPEPLPSGSQGKVREGKGREEAKKSSSSGAAAARAIDDDDLLQKLKEAANGNVAPTCRNVEPIRKLIAEGVSLEAIMACFSGNVAHLSKPLQTFGAAFIAAEAAAHAAAMATRSARGESTAQALELVFVPIEAAHWPIVEARYVRERGRKPPRKSRNPDARQEPRLAVPGVMAGMLPASLEAAE